MENNDRILISQNEELLEKIKGDLRNFTAPLRKVTDAYKALRLGDFTAEVFEEIKAGHSRKSIDRYNKALNDELDATGVRNPTLRANLLQGSEHAGVVFTQATKELVELEVKPREYGRRDEQVLSLDFITYKDGALIITKEDEEKILERHCRYYLETPDQKELYRIVKGLCDHYQALTKMNKQLDLDYFMQGTFGVVNHFVSNVGPDVQPNMDQIIGCCAYAQKKAKHAK